MNIKEIHQKICALKKELVSKSELARALGFSRQYISEMFGDNKELSPDKIQLLEKHFNVDLKNTQTEPDADAEQVLNLYIKFRSGDRQAGELLEEKIRLMKKILDAQG